MGLLAEVELLARFLGWLGLGRERRAPWDGGAASLTQRLTSGGGVTTSLVSLRFRPGVLGITVVTASGLFFLAQRSLQMKLWPQGLGLFPGQENLVSPFSV